MRNARPLAGTGFPLPPEIITRVSEYPLEEEEGGKKRKGLDRWQIKLLSPTTDNCFRVPDCVFERNGRCSAWAGQFDAHFLLSSLCLFVCPRGLTQRFLLFPRAGGLGCRLWLRDPLLLCSPSWSQEGLCCRGQYYGTARRGTRRLALKSQNGPEK